MSDEISVRLVGDNVAMGHPEGLAFFYQKIAPEVAAADIAFGNLEWPITTGTGEYARSHGRVAGHMSPPDADALVKVGFDVMSTANNHMLDHGPDAMLETLSHLDARGIRHVGSGRTLAEARSPVIIESKGVRVAFLAYTSVFLLPNHPRREVTKPQEMATLRVVTTYQIPHKVFDQPGTPQDVVTTPDPEEVEALRRDIEGARRQADAVVVSFHWGVSEGYRRRVPYQKVIGRTCIDAGASVVVGHHPHVLQGVERYKDGVICYSLGNFVFWRDKNPGPDMDEYTAILDVRLGKDGLRSASLIPVTFNDQFQPVRSTSEQAFAVLEAIHRDSREFGTRLRLQNGRIEIDR